MASQPIYQFYAQLKDYEPKIWRRFQVAGNVTLARLGYIVMTMYEMKASHLFCIDYSLKNEWEQEIPCDKKEKVIPFPTQTNRIERFEVPSEDPLLEFEDVRTHDATQMTLRRFTSEPGTILTMQYDYGDGWEVELRLEDVIMDEALPGKLLPRVLEGEGYGIIEDCGGPGGLEELTKAFQEKAGPEYQRFSEWLGCEELDTSAFDLEDMNFRLKKVPRIYRDIYEYGYLPTMQSMSLLKRDYPKK